MKRFLIVAMAATLLVGVMATPSAARPGEIHATAVGIFAEELDSGESWLRGDVLHVRNVIWRVQLLGFGDNAEYQTGEQVSVFSFNWNFKTGALSTWGSFEMELNEFDGGYTGSFHVAGPPNPDAVGGQCAPFPIYHAVGHGFGELEGAQVRWDLESDTCGFMTDMAATILFPGG
jgi:hypothetical protein